MQAMVLTSSLVFYQSAGILFDQETESLSLPFVLMLPPSVPLHMHTFQ
jgi:hypothetical protein